MSIRRARLKFESNFTQVPNDWVRDVRLSRRARGLLVELMSHAEGWTITVEHLIRNGSEGREAIRGCMKELEEFGYITRIRGRAEGGKLTGSEYVLTDPPRDGFADSRLNRESVEPIIGEPVHKEEQAFKEEQDSKNIAAPPPKAKRATQVDPLFEATPEMLDWLRKQCPLIEDRVTGETQQFIDWHKARGSTMKDWNSAWRTWMRKAQQYALERNPQAGKPSMDWMKR